MNFSQTLVISFFISCFSFVSKFTHDTACSVGQLLIVEHPCIDPSVDCSVADKFEILLTANVQRYLLVVQLFT